MLWLLIGVIDTCEVLDFTLVGELVETFHIALATHFDRAIDVDLDEIAAEILITPFRVSRPHTKAIRLMLVSRSSRLKPSPLLKCVRTTSPSSASTFIPYSLRRFSSSWAIVLFPAPESPVSQIVHPLVI